MSDKNTANGANSNKKESLTNKLSVNLPAHMLTSQGHYKPQMGEMGEKSYGSKISKARRSGRGAHPTGYSGAGHMGTIMGMLNNIDDGVTPWNKENDCIGVQDAVTLCQKAYWNVSIFRLSIDVMTEFANSKLHFKHDNKEIVNFYTNWWYKRVCGWKLSDQFFREYFRSGNVFLYKFEGDLTAEEFKDSSKTDKRGRPLSRSWGKIPLRYTILNPADIRCDGNIDFFNPTYNKLLNPYEVSRLKNPKTEQEIKFKATLPEEVKKQINGGATNSILLPLQQENLIAVFAKKQDYEALAVPMYFPVLFDINLKLEFKKAESVIARTTDYIILHVKMGAPPDKNGGTEYDPELMEAMQSLMAHESIGRVLVSDWTTEMDFVIPDLNKILGPQKYEVVNRDIADGLMNIFFNEAKFADSMIKIKMFLERLNESRRAFIESFLQPEMDLIAKEIGFNSTPTIEFEEVDLRNEVEYMKIYNRLAELGFLTPDETFEAYKSHQLPTSHDSEIAQEKFLNQKSEGLYEPITGKSASAITQETGRPQGVTAPQTKQNPQPAGASERQFSVSKMIDVISSIQKLKNQSEIVYKEVKGFQRLSKAHRETAYGIAKLIISNEPLSAWEDSLKSYIEGCVKINPETSSNITEIEEEHQVDNLMATILYHSQL